MAQVLTQSRLKELLHYDQESGIFTRLISTNNAVKVGSRAGRINLDGYRQIKVDGVTYQEHRIVWLYMTGEWPKSPLDHADRIASNNRWINLREADASENTLNRGIFRNNTSGVKGVSWSKHKNMWQSRISIKGKTRYLGYFKSIDEAEEFTRLARDMSHGEFACHGG